MNFPTRAIAGPTNRGESVSLLPRIVPETIVLCLRLAGTGNFFGIDEMSRSPITLNESPRARHVNGVPTVPESVVLEANARLIAGRFAVTLDDHAVQAGVTVSEHVAIWTGDSKK